MAVANLVALLASNPGSPVRAASALFLMGPLVAYAIDHFTTSHWHDLTADFRVMTAIGLTIVADLAVGLGFALSPVGLKAGPIAAGLVALVMVLDIGAAYAPRVRQTFAGRQAPALVLAVLALGLTAAAVVVARSASAAQKTDASGTQASLLHSPSGWLIALRNSSDAPEWATVTVTHGRRASPAFGVAIAGGAQISVPVAVSDHEQRQRVRVAVIIVRGPQRGLHLHLTAGT